MNGTQLERGRDSDAQIDAAVTDTEDADSTADAVSDTPDGAVSVSGSTLDDSPSRSTEVTPEGERLDSLSMDSIFDVLSNPRRRSTITYLNRAEAQSVELRDLAEQIAAWENDVDPHEVTYKERKRVYTSLYQSHLDKMDRLGLVRYDRNRGTVEPTAATEQLEAYLDAMTDDEEDRSRRYVPLAIAVGCVGFVVGTWTDVVALDPRYGFAVAFVVAAVFLTVSGALALFDR